MNTREARSLRRSLTHTQREKEKAEAALVWPYSDPSRTYYVSQSRCPECRGTWQRIRDAVDNADARYDAAVYACPLCGFDDFNIWPYSTRRYYGEKT